MINEILIYYRLRTLGGNLLHKNIVTMIICSQYGSIITCTVLLSKSQTSALQVKPWKWEKDIKNNSNFGSALFLIVTCGPAPSMCKRCGPARSVSKGGVRTPVKVKRRRFYLKIFTLG